MAQETRKPRAKLSQEAPKPLEPAKKPRAKLTAFDIARIRVESMCSEPTIRAWARGDVVQEANDRRIRRAAEKIGIQTAS